MRKSIALLTVFAWGCAATVQIFPQARAATLSWRFAGLKAVRENKDLVTWRDVTGLPEFAGFNSSLAQRVASSLAKPLSAGANEAEIANSLKPIAEDLVAYPTVYELNEQADGTNWMLAIQIPADRHDVWKSSWNAVSKNPKAQSAKLTREGNWTLLGTGSTKAVLDKAKQSTPDILQLNGDAVLLNKIVPHLKPTKTDLKVSVRGKSLRSEGKAQFAEDLPFKLTPWQIPTNTIREPLLGFTAIQGVSDRLGKLDAFKKHPAPNQLFIWNEGASPFSAFAAFKTDNPKTFVQDFALSLNLPDLGKRIAGNLEFDTNRYRLSLTGLPIVVPFVGPAHSNDVNFVYAGTMPLTGWSSNAMPAELTREVASRTNLVYYDWEMAYGRLAQIRPLSQLAKMARRETPSAMRDPANKWLSAAEQKLGNTITDVSLSGPRELTLVRSSDSGLSALEWFALVQWIAGPEAAQPAKSGPPAKPQPTKR